MDQFILDVMSKDCEGRHCVASYGPTMNVHTNCVCGMYHSPQIQQKQMIDENGNMVTRDVLGDRHWWELECLEYF